MAFSLQSTPKLASDAQWIYTADEVSRAPSIISGMSLEMERYARTEAIRRVSELRDVLSTTQTVMNTATMYIHRFYMKETFQKYQPKLLGVAAFYLATKVEESFRKLKVIIFTHQLLESGILPQDIDVGRDHKSPAGDDTTREYKDLAKKIVFYEEVLLRTLCFDLTIRQGHWGFIKGVRVIYGEKSEDGEKLLKAGWGFMSDTIFTTIHLTHRTDLISAAILVLSCARWRLPLPPREAESNTEMELRREEGESSVQRRLGWLEVFGVQAEEVQETIKVIMANYALAESANVRRQARLTGRNALILLEAILPAPPASESTAIETMAPSSTTPPRPTDPSTSAQSFDPPPDQSHPPDHPPDSQAQAFVPSSSGPTTTPAINSHPAHMDVDLPSSGNSPSYVNRLIQPSPAHTVVSQAGSEDIILVPEPGQGDTSSESKPNLDQRRILEMDALSRSGEVEGEEDSSRVADEGRLAEDTGSNGFIRGAAQNFLFKEDVEMREFDVEQRNWADNESPNLG